MLVQYSGGGEGGGESRDLAYIDRRELEATPPSVLDGSRTFRSALSKQIGVCLESVFGSPGRWAGVYRLGGGGRG